MATGRSSKKIDLKIWWSDFQLRYSNCIHREQRSVQDFTAICHLSGILFSFVILVKSFTVLIQLIVWLLL